MALALGTNCGFVTTAPTANPSGSAMEMDYNAWAIKHTSPATAIRITEIGWWCDNATQEANYEVGIYTDAGAGEPELQVGSFSTTNAKGTTAGWKVATGLNITISSNTVYWIALQVDNTATTTNIDITNAANARAVKFSATTLPSNWGTSSYKDTLSLIAIYAVWDTGATGTNLQININDVWRPVSEIHVNVADVWRPVASAHENIGDVWRTIF